jgi:predicted exporter
MIAWQQLQSELKGRENAVPTVITAGSIAELQRELEGLAGRIAAAKSEGLLTESVLPTSFIPNTTHQKANRTSVEKLLKERSRLEKEIGNAGFSEEGTELTSTLFEAWENYAGQLEDHEFAHPTGTLAEWSIDRLFAEKDDIFAALATVKPANPRDRVWVEQICNDRVAVASLGSLGTALNERIKEDVLRVFLPMMAILAAMLTLVFRSWRDLLLSLFSLAFAAAGMVILTAWTPMSWNSFNICGLPLLFGTGLDFSIHMIFALRRNGGDIAKTRQGIGKALIFCGTSSAIGFGSLATASAHGLASLGIVCAAGILINMVVAVWLLPTWYRAIHFSRNKV